MNAPVDKEPRGIRNHNPGNIRHNPANSWKGEIGFDDEGFSIFSTPENGLRAMLHLLHTYVYIDGVATVSGIVSRYAPRSENATDAYIESVCKGTGLHPFSTVDLQTEAGLLARSMILKEQGAAPWSAEYLQSLYNRYYFPPRLG